MDCSLGTKPNGAKRAAAPPVRRGIDISGTGLLIIIRNIDRLAYVECSSDLTHTYILYTYYMYVCNLLKSGNKLKSGKEMNLLPH